MISTETQNRLKEMRLTGMVEYFNTLAATPDTVALTADELFTGAVDWEYERRRDARLSRLKRAAKLAQPGADLSDIKAYPGRSIDAEQISRLSLGTYILNRQDVIVQGPTGSGKTYLACALGNRACQQYRKVTYLSAVDLFDQLSIASRIGEKRQYLAALVKADLLIIDDWFLTTPSAEQVQQLHTLIDQRHRTASTIFATQLPPQAWHDRIHEKILADAIIDRITSRSLTITLDCKESMRTHHNTIE